MNTLEKYWKLITASIVAFTIGIWAQYTYSNGLGAFYETINFIKTNIAIILATLGLGVSAVTLYYRIWHGKLSVRPKLELHTRSNSEYYEFILFNLGLGPATIEEYHVLVDQEIINTDGFETYKTNLSKFVVNLAALFPNTDVTAIVDKFEHLAKGNSILPNEPVKVLKLDISRYQNDEIPRVVSNISTRLKIEGKYSSMYGELYDI